MIIPKICEMLRAAGLISEAQLEQALKEQKASGERIGSILIRLGFVTEEGLNQFLSKQYGVPSVNLKDIQIEDSIIKLIPPSMVQKYGVLPISRIGRTLTIAMINPSDILAIEDIKFSTGFEIYPVVATESSIIKAIDKYYGATGLLTEVMKAIDEQKEEDLEIMADKESEAEEDISELAADSAPVVRLVNYLIGEAVKKGASDIHIEPYERELRVRYRIDGVLHEVTSPSFKLKAAIASRIKIMAKMKIEEKRMPQDGRIKVKVEDKVVDLRISTVPTIFGEKIAVRILDRSTIAFELPRLGFEEGPLQHFLRAIRNPYGIVLVTGPTGCGKTTTLYAALNKINTLETNILTAEDPIEYSLMGINQLQVRDDIGLTFGNALRSFLRQDPNIIMVGEIRDRETAEIAIRAALTGHLVLSTVHTNNAALTITRLIDMGIEPFLLASSLNLVEAQRLVRTICKNCREPVSSSLPYIPKELQRKWAGLTLYRGRGCSECHNTGYRGRIGLFEVLPITPLIREMILSRASAAEIEAKAVEEGMMTLRQDGLLKIEKGITTWEEVLRETSA